LRAGSNCINGAAVFGTVTAAAQTLSPLPQTLADTQVLFNGQPTPLYYVSPTQINFVVPMGSSRAMFPPAHCRFAGDPSVDRSSGGGRRYR